MDKTAYSVAESAGTLPIIVRRIGTSLAGNVTVDYATQDVTAISEGTPRDYAPQSGTLTFKAGEVMRTVSVPVFKDNLVDGPKTFRFNLSKNPSSVAEVVEGQSSALVTITDVDLPGVVKFVPDKYTVSETAGTVRVFVTRTGGTGGGVLVDFTTQDGTAIGGPEDDFRHTSGTLTFGFGNTSAIITIPINQDTLAEGNETFTVRLSNLRTVTGSPLLVRPRWAGRHRHDPGRRVGLPVQRPDLQRQGRHAERGHHRAAHRNPDGPGQRDLQRHPGHRSERHRLHAGFGNAHLPREYA